MPPQSLKRTRAQRDYGNYDFDEGYDEEYDDWDEDEDGDSMAVDGTMRRDTRGRWGPGPVKRVRTKRELPG